MVEKLGTNTTSRSKQTVKKFQVGDLAVYPAHGVGKIESIESRVVNGEKHEKEIPKIYNVMKERPDLSIDNQTWNRRYREYMDKIKTGSLYEVAEVFRDLSILKLSKDLSFGERKLYDTAQTLLVKELSTAQKTDEKTVALEIESFFSAEQ